MLIWFLFNTILRYCFNKKLDIYLVDVYWAVSAVLVCHCLSTASFASYWDLVCWCVPCFLAASVVLLTVVKVFTVRLIITDHRTIYDCNFSLIYIRAVDEKKHWGLLQKVHGLLFPRIYLTLALLKGSAFLLEGVVKKNSFPGFKPDPRIGATGTFCLFIAMETEIFLWFISLSWCFSSSLAVIDLNSTLEPAATMKQGNKTIISFLVLKKYKFPFFALWVVIMLLY